jgi:hypothetical protein
MDQTTACTIATALVHSKLDCCNSLLFNLPSSSTNRLQLELNSAARAVTKTSKFHHITPVLESLHWLKIKKRIHYKVISLPDKIPLSNQPSYLRSLLSLQSFRSTRSSSVVTLACPSNPSRLKLTKRSFYHTAPALWNNLLTEFRNYARNTKSFAPSASQFFKNLKHISFITLFHLNLFLFFGTDILVLTWLCVCSSHWSFSFIIHVMSYHIIVSFYFICIQQCLRISGHHLNGVPLFTGTLNQPIFTDCFIILSFSSHFVFRSSHVSWSFYY